MNWKFYSKSLLTIKLAGSLMIIIMLVAFTNGVESENSSSKKILKLTQRNDGSSWEQKNKIINKKSGQIVLEDQKWMMNFIHWWPLNETNSKLSGKYVKYLLQNVWGSMSFDFTGVEGITQVNGHKAYYVEGTLRDVVHTRFVVWNCEETKRQFLADCNINIAFKTPEYYLKLQFEDITESIDCHHSENDMSSDGLPKRIQYDTLDIALNLPNNWRSNPFIIKEDSEKISPGHYKKSINDKRGVLWNLNSESHRIIDLSWSARSEKLNEIEFRNAIQEKLSNEEKKQSVSTFKIKPVVDDLRLSEFSIECSGSYDLVTTYQNGYVDTANYLFKAHQWINADVSYLLINAMVAHDSFWNIPVDLKPDPKQLEYFDAMVLKYLE